MNQPTGVFDSPFRSSSIKHYVKIAKWTFDREKWKDFGYPVFLSILIALLNLYVFWSRLLLENNPFHVEIFFLVYGGLPTVVYVLFFRRVLGTYQEVEKEIK